MTWHAPWLLWLLGLVPLLAAAMLIGLRLRRAAAQRFGNAEAIKRLLIGRATGLRAARAVIVLLGVTLAVIALARPQYGSRTRLLRKRGVDVVIALDFSKSMLARDVRPSRIDRAKAEVTAFLNELAGDRVGMVAFAGETMEFPMTVDYSAASLFFRDMGPYDMPVGGTAIGRALTASQRLLERSTHVQSDDKNESPDKSPRARVVILMTDGEDHEGDPVAAAEDLAKIGARVYVVGIGTRSGEPIPTYADDGTWTGYMRDNDGKPVLTAMTADSESQLKKIAQVTSGKYFAAGRGSVGMDQIRAEMRRMKQSELKARKVTVHEERYAPVLLFAFLLILLEALLPEALFSRKRDASGKRGSAGASVLMIMGVTFASLATWVPEVAQAELPAWLRMQNGSVDSGNQKLIKGDAKGALTDYDGAARQLPDTPGVQLDRGLALLKQGELAKAKEALQSATDPGAPPAIRADAYENLALALYREADGLAQQKKHDEAQRLFRESADAAKRSLRMRPGDADAGWNLELASRRIREEEQKQKEDEQKQKDDKKDQDKQKQDQQNQDQKSDPNQDQNKDQQDQKDQKPDPKDQKPDQKDQPKPDQPKPDQQKQDQQKQDQQQADQQKQDQAQKPVPREVEHALDALQDGEENFERVRAKQRASQERRAPEKDW